MSQIASAIAYLSSKESRIMPTKFERLVEQVKDDIQRKAFGSLLEFPDPKKRVNRSTPFDPVERGQTVNAVNELRSQGKTAKGACEAIGVPLTSYRHWSSRCRIKYIKN
jgi:hypothetical protein|tara:strand:+ start:106 stop:432 length:327 start_codon:yes stop_codon:yes gene_type:complete